MTVLNESKLEYFNSYGLVFHDRFYVSRENNLLRIDLNKVKTIRLIKGRKYEMNFFSFISSCLIIYFSFLLENNLMMYKYVFYISAVLLIIISFNLKKFCYKIVVVTKDYQLISINVSKGSKNDAKKIIEEVNKKKLIKQSLKAC